MITPSIVVIVAAEATSAAQARSKQKRQARVKKVFERLSLKALEWQTKDFIS